MTNQSDNNPPSAAPSPRPEDPLQPQQAPPELIAQMMANRGGFLPLPIMQAPPSINIWQGQFPPPEAIERYEKTLSGTFNRIISMTEQLQAAQIKEAERLQTYTHVDAKRAQFLGAAIAAFAMVCAVVCVMLNYPWVAGIFVSVPVMAVAKSLVELAKRERSSDILRTAQQKQKQ